MTGTLYKTPMKVNRLVVLVPEEGVYGVDLARRIWTLAEPCELKVLFLCAPGHPIAQESALRLRLITLASQIRNEKVTVEIRIEKKLNWVRAAWEYCGPGDIVICCAEQKVETTLQGQVPLSQVLEEALDVPIFVLPGYYRQEPVKSANMVRELVRWVTPIVAAAIFILVETHIDTISIGVAHSVLLATFALTEVGLIAVMSLLI